MGTLRIGNSRPPSPTYYKSRPPPLVKGQFGPQLRQFCLGVRAYVNSICDRIEWPNKQELHNFH